VAAVVECDQVGGGEEEAGGAAVHWWRDPRSACGC
jgi:hypothetical protein